MSSDKVGAVFLDIVRFKIEMQKGTQNLGLAKYDLWGLGAKSYGILTLLPCLMTLRLGPKDPVLLTLLDRDVKSINPRMHKSKIN